MIVAGGSIMMMRGHRLRQNGRLQLWFPAHGVVNKASRHNRKNKMYFHHIEALFPNPNVDSQIAFPVA